MRFTKKVTQTIILILCICTFSHAQSIESLQKQIKDSSSDTESLRLYNKIGVAYRDINYHSKAIQAHNQALILAKQGNDSSTIASTLSLLGTAYLRNMQTEEAEGNYLKALSIAKNNNIYSEEINTLNSLGLCYKQMGKHTQALKYHKQALELIKTNNQTEKQAATLNHIANLYLSMNQHNNALKYYNEALDFHASENDSIGMADIYRNLGISYRNQGKYTDAVAQIDNAIQIVHSRNMEAKMADYHHLLGGIYWQSKAYKDALDNYLIALEIRERLNLAIPMASTLNNIGLIYKDLNNYEMAINYYKQSLGIYKKLNDIKLMAHIYNLLGSVNWQMKNFDQALDYYLEALALREQINDPKLMAASYNNLGLVYRSMGELETSKENYETALNLYQKANDKTNVAAVYHKLGSLYLSFDDVAKAEIEYKKALALREEAKDKLGKASTLVALGKIELNQSNTAKATEMYNEALDIALAYDNINLEASVRNAIAAAYAKLGKYNEAYEQLQKYNSLRSKILNSESIKKIADMQIRYEMEKKERALQEQKLTIFKQQERNKNQLNLIYFILAIVLVTSYFLFSIARKNKLIKKSNLQLAAQNTEILEQKEEIMAQRDAIEVQKNEIEKQHDILEVQKKKITDSISYAARIQQAVMPPEEQKNSVIPNHFILFKPKDIVSGDFYWMTEIDGKSIVATVDCTGHGVPGAFMSMLGTSLLTEIVNSRQWNDAADILNELRTKVKKALHQTGSKNEARDGMDCTLCIIDYKAMQVDFAGAYNPLYIIRQGELIEQKSDRMPIGVYARGEKPFTNHNIQLQADDLMYTFSDGYHDQFGGEKGRKLLAKNFKQLLLDNSHLPMENQKEVLDSHFENWRGNYNQLDDVLVIGVKVCPKEKQIAAEHELVEANT